MLHTMMLYSVTSLLADRVQCAFRLLWAPEPGLVTSGVVPEALDPVFGASQ